MPPKPGERSPQQEEGGSWVNAELMLEALGGGATVLRVDVQPAVAQGENFFSTLYRARVEFHASDSEEVQVRSLIVKGVPIGEFMHEYAQETCAFRREASIYGDALPRMYAFADARLGKDSFKKFSAGYYKTSRPDTLILDDLKPCGFVMASRRDRLDLAHAKLVIQYLARFHALSSAYTEAHPEYIAQFEDKMFNEGSRARLKMLYPHIFKMFADNIRQWEGIGHITKKFDALQEKYADKLIDVCKLVEGSRKVLAHGDCWVNNMMFRYAESDSPVDLHFVDFQLTRVASPALDLNYFLFTSLRTEVRVHHLEEILQEYCDVFGRSAKELGYHGPLISVEEIRQEMDRMAFYAFTATISTMVSMLRDPEDALDVATITEEVIQSGEDPGATNVYASARFRETFENLLPYFDERGVFD